MDYLHFKNISEPLTHVFSGSISVFGLLILDDDILELCVINLSCL